MGFQLVTIAERLRPDGEGRERSSDGHSARQPATSPARSRHHAYLSRVCGRGQGREATRVRVAPPVPLTRSHPTHYAHNSIEPGDTHMAPPPVIRLHPEDSVVIARATLLPGAPVADNVVAAERIPAGHKAAVRAIAKADAIRRYGQIIGFASSRHLARPARARAQLRNGRLRQGLRLWRRREDPRGSSTHKRRSRASAAPMAAWRRATTSAS